MLQTVAIEVKLNEKQKYNCLVLLTHILELTNHIFVINKIYNQMAKCLKVVTKDYDFVLHLIN